MRFILDENMPLVYQSRLQSLGHECLHIAVLAKGTRDEEVWSEVVRQQAVLITRDQRFARRMGRGLSENAGIILSILGHHTNAME